MTDSTNPYRLPTNVAPSNYRLELTPNIDAASFEGRVTVALDVTAATSTIQFNSVDLNLEAITVTGADGVARSATAELDTTYERATISFSPALPLGPATLEIKYRGELTDKLVGFYRSSYKDDDGVTQWIATTQFEATDARRAFPCWDEPTFKATFDVTLNVPANLAAYSNSPIVSETPNGDGTRKVVFGRTMKMSTYLVAFVVGPFQETVALDVRGTPLRVVVPKGKLHLADYALSAGEFALSFFSDYFDIPYPGDKLDLVAVPDFAFGAMENLGCVTFRESALLVDPQSASLAELERVADVVAHEIAHMWFGDLVTMQWWEGIWLNEAFATFMETLCVEHYRPQWKKWLSFAPLRDQALQIDGLHATRPIEYEVVAPTDMNGMFDALTYEKGCAVLRMLEQYIGPEVFRDGIRRYLKEHSYANTVTTDLWDALESASGQPVRELMNSFILQGGHPLVTYADGQLSQSPFSYAATRTVDSAIGTTWMMPVLTRSANGGPLTRRLLGAASETLVADGPMVVNAGGWGVFRTRYGSRELLSLTSNLERLDELERNTLVADSWAELFASQITWEDFLAVARALGNQDEPATWQTLALAFDTVNRAVRDDQRPRLAALVREIFQPQFDRLGFGAKSDESELARQVRSVAIDMLGTIGGVAAVRDEARRRFDSADLDGDTARAVLRVVASTNHEGDYETFLARFRAASTPQEMQRYQWGLADFPDETVALDAAEKCFSEFRGQDGPIVLGLLGRNRVSGPAVWRFLTAQWDEAVTKFSGNLLLRTVTGIPNYITDRAFAAEVEAFHRAHPIAGEERRLEQLFERMRVGLDFTDAIRRQI